MSVIDLLTKEAALVYKEPGPADDYGQPTWTVKVVPVHCYYRKSESLVEDSVSRESETLRVYIPPETPTAYLTGMELDDADYVLASIPVKQWNARTRVIEYIMMMVRQAVS